MAGRLKFSTSNSQVTDEIINVPDATARGLYHDIFYNKTGKLVVISTAAGGGGTVLTETTDYTIGGAIADASLPISISPDVAYTTVAITNATYHDTDLYVAYYPLGDLIEVEDLPYWQINDTSPEWDTSESSAYESAGVIVKKATMHFASTGKASNSAKNPLLPGSKTWWIPAPSSEELIRSALQGMPMAGNMHPVHDRADGNYLTSLRLDTRYVDGTFYDFWGVHLDGSVVTGDATLVARLDVGGANEHPFIDIFAPDSLGTRTLIDMGEYAIVGQSASGESDTVGDLQDDRMQGHWHGGFSLAAGSDTWFNDRSQTGADPSRYGGSDPITDGTNGTPRTGLTTRGKQLVNGCSYIVSMIPQ